MDSVGTLSLSWAKGYQGEKAEYIDSNTICFVCGHNVTFIKENGEETYFPSPGEGVGPLAVHSINKLFAFADLCLNPKIFVYSYPNLKPVVALEGGAQLEYCSLVFSSSNYLASVSGVPEFELTLWNYVTATKLCSIAVDTVPGSISFNPANWRQVCFTTEKSLIVYNAEQSNERFLFKTVKPKIPLEDGTEIYEEQQSDIDELNAMRASTHLSKTTIDLPQTAVAGVSGKMVQKFEEMQDTRPRVVPKSHCWTPTGDLYVGCEGGQLLKVDGESYKAKVLYTPGPKAATPEPLSREASKVSLGKIGKKVSIADDIDEPTTDSDLLNLVPDGALNCLALHKSGLYTGGQDGILRKLEFTGGKVKVAETCPVGLPITWLNFATTYDKLAIGSSRGALHVHHLSNPGSTTEIFDIHHGHFVAVDSMMGGESCVSLRDDGEVQVWDFEKAKLLGSIPLAAESTCLACSPMCHIAVVGTVDGYLYFIDLSNLKNLRVIHRVHAHQGPCSEIVFDKTGMYLFTGSDDGHVFVVDGRPSAKFEFLAHTDVEGEVRSITVHNDSKFKNLRVLVTSNNLENKRLGANKIVVFGLNEEVMNNFNDHYASFKKDLKPSSVNKMILNFDVPSYGGAIIENDVFYTLAQNNRKLHKIQLPEKPPQKPDNEDMLMEKSSFMVAEEEYHGHQLPGGRIMMSPHYKWVASYGPDGKLMLRTTSVMDKYIEITPHDYRHGGIRHVAFTPDAQLIMTTGFDGILTCYKWKYSAQGSKGKSAIEAARAQKMHNHQKQQEEDAVIEKMPDWSPASRPPTGEQEEKERREIEKAIADDAIYTTPTPVPGHDATWLEGQELRAIKEEDKEYADTKRQLRTEIREMRRTIQKMMQENESVPDIEKLGRHEFDLDIDEQTRLQNEADAEVERIREEIEFENLAKQYLKDLIKKECWDEMEVKGRSIEGFNQPIEVSNYPMKKRTDKELAELQYVTMQKQVEADELKARRELTEISQKPAPTSQISFLNEVAGEDKKGAEDDLNETDDVEREGKEDYATAGSLGAKYGGGNPLLYSQFELHSREQKQFQITLLQDAIYRIKQQFNKEFEEVYTKKEQEIGRVQDRNKRILKILDDLDLTEDVHYPNWSVNEKPERLLVVDDSEVTVEKYLTPAQRKIKEAEEKAEAERRAREKGDNARERALDMMMGGVLEIKKEDELKKDIPVPAFMKDKDEEDWTEEEQKAAKEYEKRVKDLNEEREKFRKQLEMELKKLQSLNQDTEENFDETLKSLFVKKVKTEMAIYQEELKIIRLQYSMLIEEELENREKELTILLEHKKQLRTLATQAVIEARKNADEFREQYDILLAEDKVMDKAFKREFNDVPAVQLDALSKLFRKKPRIGRAPLKRAETPIYDPKSGNPFAERPSSARQQEMAHVSMENAMAEMDKESNMPEGVEPEVWERLCKYRRTKIDGEQLLKQKALVLAEMNDFLKRRQEEEELLKNEITDTELAISRLKEDKMRFTCNLEVQLVLKQGQVEVDPGNFIHNFSDSILVHRSVVEDLNSRIKQLGEGKISSMTESKDFRKGIIQLEWEHKKNLMQIEDLSNKMRDINMMKVTRQIQAFLSEEDHDAKKAQEIAVLEQTLVMQRKHHEKNVDEQKQMLKELRKTIKQKEEENRALERELEELNVSVNERQHIDDVNADKKGDVGIERRYQEIVQRRKLVDLAKAQAQEVAVLRAEVERLRMRTFPALVQVEH